MTEHYIIQIIKQIEHNQDNIIELRKQMCELGKLIIKEFERQNKINKKLQRKAPFPQNSDKSG